MDQYITESSAAKSEQGPVWAAQVERSHAAEHAPEATWHLTFQDSPSSHPGLSHRFMNSVKEPDRSSFQGLSHDVMHLNEGGAPYQGLPRGFMHSTEAKDRESASNRGGAVFD